MSAFSSILFLSTICILGSSAADHKNDTTAKVAAPSTPPLYATASAVHKHHKKHTKLVDGNITEIEDEGWEYENQTFVDTRRVLYGRKVALGKRPYMVYLQLTKESAKIHKYRGWLCGGVIVHQYYVLTSAACVEDADHFYVVSGTAKYVESSDYKKDECVCKHRRKVVWKCVPKNYKFDFQDSIKWSSNDIAIVKVDKCFKFGQKEKGCQYATQPILYNNISRSLERPNVKGWIAGWGSMGNFREGVYRRDNDNYKTINAKCLQEAKVCLMDNEACAKKWAQRFRPIITEYMICTRDVMRRLSEICDKKYANCTEIEARRRALEDSTDVEAETQLDLGRHLREPDSYVARRTSMQGGFCENDHGGPLIVQYQHKERAIGVISACKIDPRTHSCHGPFLYTSIFKNRQFISCSIYKDVEESCRRVFRTGITHEEYTVDWSGVEEDNVFEGDKAERDGDDKKAKGKPGSDDDEDESSDAKDDKDDDDDDDDDGNDKNDKEALRAKTEKKDKKAKRGKKLDKKQESESKETSKKKTAEKEENKSEENNEEDKKDDKKTIKRKSKKRKDKKSKGSLRSDKKIQSYESSKDEKVNEPDE